MALEYDRAWLASGTRCIIDDTDADPGKIQREHRLPTLWWLAMIDTFLRGRTTQGLEAFSSKETADAVRKLCKKTEWPEYI